MQKIIIIGNPGSGKSTLASKLGKKLNLPVFHLDSFFFEANWVIRNRVNFDDDVNKIVQKDAWIIDGNYGRTMPLRIEKADTIILLDFPTYKSLFRVLKRRIQYHNKTRADMAAGCIEKLDYEFLHYVATFRKKKLPKIIKRLENMDKSKQVFIFKSDKEVEAFLKEQKRIK